MYDDILCINFIYITRFIWINLVCIIIFVNFNLNLKCRKCGAQMIFFLLKLYINGMEFATY